MEQEYLLRGVFGRHFLNQNPYAGALMVDHPSNLVGAQLDRVARSGLQLHEMESAALVTDQNVRYPRRGPCLQPRRIQVPVRLRQTFLHLPPKSCFALLRGCRNCSLPLG
jgi:hypothetical protein